ncbi:hypothetical protein ES695_03510 [Candidatus Atribacteria bacterium 1244-E10-H5-B2]|nr:MAG: hypothetical protein ES695_03510 [Candidatus Atribacteria bacterium 1244-E10-H5-B2]
MKKRKIIFSRADNLKVEMFCLWNGMKNSLVPLMFAQQFQKEMEELKGLISEEEYQEFLSKCFGVKLENAVEQAENIIKKKRS